MIWKWGFPSNSSAPWTQCPAREALVNHSDTGPTALSWRSLDVKAGAFHASHATVSWAAFGSHQWWGFINAKYLGGGALRPRASQMLM